MRMQNLSFVSFVRWFDARFSNVNLTMMVLQEREELYLEPNADYRYMSSKLIVFLEAIAPEVRCSSSLLYVRLHVLKPTQECS